MSHHNSYPPIEVPGSLREAGVMVGLRPSSQAITYFDSHENFYLQPVGEQDFVYFSHMQEQGLTAGTLVSARPDQLMVKYDSEVDLTTLPEIFNASIRVEDGDGQQDIFYALSQTGNLLQTLHQTFGAIPNVASLRDIAINRTTGKAELLPPFVVEPGLMPVHIFDRLQQESIMKAVGTGERAMIAACFAHAAAAFAEQK